VNWVRVLAALALKSEPKLVAAQDILRIAGRHVVRLTFMGEIDGEPQLDDDHIEFRWFDVEEIKKLENLDIYVKELIEKHIILNDQQCLK